MEQHIKLEDIKMEEPINSLKESIQTLIMEETRTPSLEEQNLTDFTGMEVPNGASADSKFLFVDCPTSSQTVQDEANHASEIDEVETVTSNELDHLDANDRRHICEICGKKLSSKRNLSNHLHVHSTAHVNCIQFECSSCQKVFKSENRRSVHVKYVHRDLSFECKVCSKKFGFKSELECHEIVHSEARPVQCSLCSKRFKSKRTLRSHMIHHSDSRPFLCDVCGKAFKLKYGLKDHMDLHSNNKIFACEICEMKFKANRYLRKHREIHSDSFDYKCDTCGNKFRTELALLSHKRIHEVENCDWLKCKICDKGFRSKGNLRIHMVTHSEKLTITANTARKRFDKRQI